MCQCFGRLQSCCFVLANYLRLLDVSYDVYNNLIILSGNV